MKKIVLAALLTTIASNAMAVDIPQPKVNAGFDRIRTSTGAECQTSLDTGRYLTAGLYATNDSTVGEDVGVYVGIVFKFGMDKVKSVKDCNKWLRLQEQRDAVEVQKLQAELEFLKLQTQALQQAAEAEKLEVPEGEDW